MAGKEFFIEYMDVFQAPSSSKVGVLSAGSKKGRSESFMTENTTKTLYKNRGGGCSSKISQSHKTGVFVDKRNGNQGFKKETKYTSSVKVNDKAKGCTIEYETQVKCKKVTTYNNDSSKRARGHATAAESKSKRARGHATAAGSKRATAAGSKSKRARGHATAAGSKSSSSYEIFNFFF